MRRYDEKARYGSSLRPPVWACTLKQDCQQIALNYPSAQYNMPPTNSAIRVMFKLKSPPKANRLFGLGLRIWDVVGMKRFEYAVIE